MIHWQIYLSGLVAIGFFAMAGWLLSLARNNVNHIEGMWSLFIGMSAYLYSLFFYHLHERNIIIIALITLWALLACSYQTVRYWKKPENSRYQALRQTNGSFFWLTSLYQVFGLHAVLAWSISMPLFVSIQSSTPLSNFDHFGVAVVAFGLSFQSIAHWQLYHFKQHKHNIGKVLNTGLWRYSRHPHYFGECCVWWGFYCIALSTDAWWSIISPVLMTLLLLQDSMAQNHLSESPNYQAYQRTTNAFFPWQPKP